MKTDTKTTRAAMEEAASNLANAKTAFADAERVAVEKRNAYNFAVREAASAEGPDLVEALEARAAAQRAAIAADDAVLSAGREWKAAVKAESDARRAHRAARAPGARAEVIAIANAIDGHFAAIEKILADAAPLAAEIQRDLCIYKGSGIWLNSPEIGQAPLLGLFRIGPHDGAFKDLVAVYRDCLTSCDASVKGKAA